jgi:hypothetical protein
MAVNGNAATRICKGTRKDGQPCGARAMTADGLCAAHGGLVDMAAIGQAGGQARSRSVLGINDEVADDRLRAKAKRRLEELLDSDDESKRLAAARSLYSYQATKPPAEEQSEQDHERISHGGATIADVIELSLAYGAITEDDLERIKQRAAELRQREGLPPGGFEHVGIPGPGDSTPRLVGGSVGPGTRDFGTSPSGESGGSFASCGSRRCGRRRRGPGGAFRPAPAHSGSQARQ